MPHFLFKASYSPEGVKGVAQKGGTARRDALAQTFSSNGGSMEGFYFAFGGADAYVFGELPDNETAAAVAMNVNATGAAAVETSCSSRLPRSTRPRRSRSTTSRPAGEPYERLSIGT